MSTLLSSIPGLLCPKGLIPFKKKAKKTRRPKTKPTRAAEDDAAKATTPEQSKTTTTVNSAHGTTPNSSPPKPTPLKASVPNTVAGRLWQSMKFRGGAPELINGRCAMVAIPSIMANEMIRKEPFLQSISEHKVIFAAVVLTIAVASLIPIARGAKMEAFGFMTPYAELINGRAAMIGVLGIILLEARSGTHMF